MEPSDNQDEFFKLFSVILSEWNDGIDANISESHTINLIQDVERLAPYDLDADFDDILSSRGEISKFSASIGSILVGDKEYSIFKETIMTSLGELEHLLFSLLDPEQVSA